jgi:hypothetical protein
MALRSFWFTLLFASLLFVGCGTDEPAEQAAKNDENARTTERRKDTPGDKDKKQTPADDDEPKIDFDVSYITEEYVAAIAIRPAGIVGTPLVADVRKLLKSQLGDEFPLDRNISKFQEMFGFDPQQVEEIIILVDQQMVAAGPGMFGGRDEAFGPEAVPSDDDEIPSKSDDGADSDDDEADADDAKDDKVPTAPSEKDAPKSERSKLDLPQAVESKQQPLPTAIIRFGQKIDRETLLKPIRGQVRQLGELIEKQHAGHDYLVSSKAGFAAHFPDDQTVVVAPEESLKKMLTAKNVDSPLIQQLKSVGQHQLVVAVDVAAMSAMVSGLAAAGPEGVGQVAEKVKGVTLTLDLDRKPLLKLSVLAGSASDATDIAKAAQGYLAIGQGFYALSKGQQLENATPEQRQLIDSLVAGTGVAQNGTTITLTIKTPDGLENLPELMKPLIAQAQAAAKRSSRKSDLKFLAIALHNYHEVYRHFPTAIDSGADPKVRKKGALSWRVHLLNQLEEPGLYNQFHLDEPWDSEHNKTLIKQMPKIFGNDPEGKTSVHVFTGEGTPFGGNKTGLGFRFRDISDGTSNTFFAVEAGPDKAEIWTKPGGLPFDAKNPMAALGKIGDKFFAAFLDGRVLALPKAIDADTMSNLIQHADGNVVEIP